MAFTDISLKFFFIGFLFSIGLIQNVVSQSTKIYTQSNSASWQGKSPFKEFWSLDSKEDHQGEEALLLKLLKLLTKENAAYKRIEYTDILTAMANLDFNITETPDKMSSFVTIHIVLKTSADNQNSKSQSDPADKIESSQTSAKNSNPATDKQLNAANKNSQPSKFNEMVLERHNVYRKKHRVPALVYSKQISDVSQDWATKLAEKNEFKHRPNNRYGENLFASWSSNPNHQLSPNAAVDAWYAEIKHYTYSKSANISLVGHFTQLVWKNSKELGIGVAKSKTNTYYVVCNYSPPGNVIGQFAENVLRPSKS